MFQIQSEEDGDVFAFMTKTMFLCLNNNPFSRSLIKDTMTLTTTCLFLLFTNLTFGETFAYKLELKRKCFGLL